MQKTGASCRALSSARPHPLRCRNGSTVLDWATAHGNANLFRTPTGKITAYVDDYFSDVAAYLRSVGAQTSDSLVSSSAPAPEPAIVLAAVSGDVKVVRGLLLADPASVHQRDRG